MNRKYVADVSLRKTKRVNRLSWSVGSGMLFINLLVLLLAGNGFAIAEDASTPSAENILSKSDEVLDPGESTADLEMTIKREGEKNRIYRMALYSGGRDRMLILFQYPPRNKGQAFLRIRDDIWIYAPNVSRTIRLPKRQAFAGGDFSNYDVLSVRLHEHYSAELEQEEVIDDQPCYRLLLTARSKSAPYSSIRCWVRKKDFWPVKREYNTRGHNAFKTLRFYSKESKQRPDTFVMNNIIEKTKTSEVVWKNMKNVKHNPRIFTEGYLRRRR